MTIQYQRNDQDWHCSPSSSMVDPGGNAAPATILTTFPSRRFKLLYGKSGSVFHQFVMLTPTATELANARVPVHCNNCLLVIVIC